MARAWWPDQAGRPRFVFVNVLDPHHPYDPPSDDRARFLGGNDPREALAVPQEALHYFLEPGLSARQKQLLGALYDAEIASMDREIGLFIEWLRSRKELDRTILVVTSDHGERLGERGLVGHDLVMDPYILRVPLLVRYPPSVAPSRVKRRVQLDGLPGYIAHLARVPCSAAMDESALDRQDRKVVVAQYQDPSWFTRRLVARNPGFDVRPYTGDWFLAADERFVYVCSQLGGGSDDCVLNDSWTDPDWIHDAQRQHPAVVEELKQAVGRLPSFRPARARPIERDLLERIRSLGYLD